MSNQELNEAFEGIPLVDVTSPDGTVYHFRFGAMVPYAGAEYAVLLEMELDENGEEQVLITKVEKTEDGSLAFVVAEEEDIIQAAEGLYDAGARTILAWGYYGSESNDYAAKNAAVTWAKTCEAMLRLRNFERDRILAENRKLYMK